MTTLVTTDATQARLLDLEHVIEQGFQSFMAVGRALLEIQTSRLYRRDHATFEDYCRARWGISISHAYQFINATKVAEALPAGTQPPSVESQTRALGQVLAEEGADAVAEVWTEVLARTHGKPTAAAVAEVVAERREIFESSRPDDATDYREWGRRATERLAAHPEVASAVLLEAMTAKARQHVARGMSRTAGGVARFVADQRVGQLVEWTSSTDDEWLRDEARRLKAEGEKKVRLADLMTKAANCVTARPGMTAMEAWIADGFDPAVIDAAVQDE